MLGERDGLIAVAGSRVAALVEAVPATGGGVVEPAAAASDSELKVGRGGGRHWDSPVD